MIAQEPVGDLQATLKRAWELLAANPVIVVPGLVLAVFGGVVIFFALLGAFGSFVISSATGNANVGIFAAALTLGTSVATILLLSLVQAVLTTGMAATAWKTGRTTLADGWNVFVQRWQPALATLLVLFIIGCCAVVLGLLTFGLAFLAFAVFLLYALPAAIVGGLGPADAIAESCKIAQERFVPTVLLALLVVVCSFGGGIIGGIAGVVTPVVGHVVSAVIQQAAVCFGMLAVVGEYVKLHAQAEV